MSTLRTACLKTFLAAICIIVATLLPGVTFSADRDEVEREFRAWIDGPVWSAASSRGISRATFDSALSSTRLEWSLPDLRPPGAPDVAQDWRQTEFRKPARYFDEGNLNTLVSLGRGHVARWKSALETIEARHGVPGEILVAIWARESAFGNAKIPHDAVAILATQAFMGRRREMFLGELMAALEMIERGHVARGDMRSSWAGALGQPQFLPSKYLLYATDGDGDGIRDIWNSVPDTLASIANFLNQNGWQKGRDWGFEAAIPDSV
jgi:lytic murein transglycosylase